MRKNSALLLVVLVSAVVAAAPSALLAQRGGRPGIPNDAASVEHALKRLTFGPRAGDVDRVQRAGLDNWIDRQLNPSQIDDAAAMALLPPLPSPPRTVDTPQEARRFGREEMQALAAQKLMRAVYSERQLDEVLVDFWFNHFNVFAGKGRTATFLVEYEREAIRPHIWGSFRELLGATAQSPAMLFYLDNWLSADPEAAERAQELANQRRARRGGAAQPQAAQAANRRRGLNENYGRELLELHTLGVDGGYTQKDIIEVARAFTGWTIANERAVVAGAARRQNGNAAQPIPYSEGGFRFTPMLHDRGEKIVLGQKIKAGGGIEDGEKVLDIVAAHPSTAHHIATKLVRRFVNDTPPEALVARVAARFTETHGNLREVVRAVITSPEFFDAANRGVKMKTPIEFVVSALRATGRDVADARPALRALQQLGMMPYMSQPPTGYDDDPATWISAGGLVARMNIAQQLAGPRASEIGGPEFQRR